MEKIIKVIDEDTLEIKEISVKENVINDLKSALNCDPEEFYKKYKNMKEAEKEFNEIYEPFKENLIKLHEQKPNLPKSVVVGGAKLTYISPSKRTTIDSKKLKEEEPELAKKFSKISNVRATIKLEEV